MTDTELAKQWIEYFRKQEYNGTVTLSYQNGIITEIKTIRNYNPEELKYIKSLEESLI